MKIKTPLLLVLLAVQCAAVLLLGWFQSDNQSGAKPQSLLSFDIDSLDRVSLTGKDAQVLELKRTEGQWKTTINQLPADSSKTNNLISQLQKLQAGWPVSTTVSSHQRFEVAEDKFQNKIGLYTGDQLLAELLVGNSPGFKKSYVRKPDTDEVYAVELAQYDLALNEADWLDNRLLSIDNVKAVSTENYQLSIKDNQWIALTQDEQPIELDQGKAMQFINQLENFSVLQLKTDELTGEPKDQDSVQQPVETRSITLSVSSADQQYQLTLEQTGTQYTATRSDRNVTFLISQTTFDTLYDVKWQDWVVQTESTLDDPDANQVGTNQNQGLESNQQVTTQ